MSKRLVNLIIIIVGIFLIISTVKAIFGRWGAGGKVVMREQQVSKLETENRRLENELEKSKNPEFIEKMAREKLSLVKPGEVVVILPKEFMAAGQGEFRDLSPNCEKWWDLVN